MFTLPDAPSIATFYGTEPALIVQNPELIKLVTTKDFYYFSSREVSKYYKNEVFTQNMFFTCGDRWKVMRQNFTPLFSSTKMKNMFPLIVKCAYIFEDLLDDVSKTNVVEVRFLMSRFTMDCFGSCAFGVETNAMLEGNYNPFRKMGDAIFELSNFRGFSIIARAIWPSIFYGAGLRLFPIELDKFFNKLVTNVFEARNYEASSRNDFIDLLIGFKKQNFLYGDGLTNMKTEGGKKSSLKADDDLLVTQSMTYFAAGFETSATTLSYALFELAKSPEAQNRAIEEVDEFLLRHKYQLDYSCITELPYLTACIDETLRLYPVLGLLTREVVEDYTLPNGVFLEKGMSIHLPVYHLHHNPEFFPDSEQFQPERFLPKSKQNIIPYTYMPFGEGPRICIGLRFAMMQMLAGLVTLLKKYRLELADNMSYTVEFNPRGLVTVPLEGIRLKLMPREGWEKRVLSRQKIE